MPRSLFVCSYENCTAIFRHSERYENHLRTHTGERPFKCSFDGCDKTYKRSSHLKRHEEIHKNLFRCTLPGCSQILKTKATLMKHQDVFHNKKEKEVKKYKCAECSEEFTKHCMLRRHTYIHSGVHPYKCTEPGCGKTFSIPSKVKRHMKNHTGYFCEESDCALFFPRWTLLRKHKKECHPKVYRCNICEKVFKLSCNFKEHSLTHKLEKDIHPCTVPKCTRVYPSKRGLSVHVRNFHGTYTLACPEGNCHRFLKTEKELEIHIQRKHRRRTKNKRPPPEKADFAEILVGFAKGSKKDLNPHLSNTLSEEEVEDENSEIEMICLDSSNSSEDDDDEQCSGSKRDFNQHLPNTILEETDVICLDDSSDDVSKDDEKLCSELDEGLKKDLNTQLPNYTFFAEKGKELKDKNMEVDATCRNSLNTPQDDNDELCLDNQVSETKQDLNPPLSNIVSKMKFEESEGEFMEVEVVYHGSLDSSLDEEQCLDGENYSLSCKAEADPTWISSDRPISRVK